MTSLDRALAIAIGAFLRWKREELGITQRELGRRLGLGHPIITRRERGTHTMELPTIATHAASVGATLDDIGRVVDGVLATFGTAADAAPTDQRPPWAAWVSSDGALRRRGRALQQALQKRRRTQQEEAAQVVLRARQRMHHAAAPVLTRWAARRASGGTR